MGNLLGDLEFPMAILRLGTIWVAELEFNLEVPAGLEISIVKSTL